MTTDHLIVRIFAKQPYLSCVEAMRQFTEQRLDTTQDEVWLLEHEPVFTQGQNGKAEHVLNAKDIPVIPTDRGGQVTYHGPGQLMMYTLIDLKRKKIHIRQFVELLEKTVIDFLTNLHIITQTKCHARGVYVLSQQEEKKICSIGLRVKRGCTYHGLAFNIAMDLEPFSRINPCGYTGLKMAQLSEFCQPSSTMAVGKQLVGYFMKNLGYTGATLFTGNGSTIE